MAINNRSNMSDGYGSGINTATGTTPQVKNTFSTDSFGNLSFHPGSSHTFNMIDNYIYFYHLDKFILIPAYPDSVTDSMGIQFYSTTPLSRSAPIQSFSSAGPRTVTFQLRLHRDMMQDINYNRSNYVLNNLGGQLDDDYMDAVIKELQCCVMPKYEAASKTVKPPIIAVRFGAQIFCKGVVTSNVSMNCEGPLLSYSSGLKYALCSVTFNVTEIDPYDADTVMKKGGFRGLNSTLEKGLFKSTDMNGIGNRATSDPAPRWI